MYYLPHILFYISTITYVYLYLMNVWKGFNGHLPHYLELVDYYDIISRT
jgi:hypothetical protein